MVVQAGLVGLGLGLIGLLRPLRWLALPTRRRAGAIALAGLSLVVLGFLLPAPEVRVPPRTRLDEYAPAYQFHELHQIYVNAPPARVFAAIEAVTADEIWLFRTLTWIRRLGQPGPESIMNAPEHRPLLEVATRTSFLRLAREPEREIVVGTLVIAPPGARLKAKPTAEDFQRLARPGFAKATMNFLVAADRAGGSRVTTETRVYATSDSARRRFAAYWRVIYPGRALIRRMWLRAIRRRAEAPA
jgi:hypothetical protein